MIIGSTMDNLDGTYVICMLESRLDLNFMLGIQPKVYTTLAEVFYYGPKLLGKDENSKS